MSNNSDAPERIYAVFSEDYDFVNYAEYEKPESESTEYIRADLWGKGLAGPEQVVDELKSFLEYCSLVFSTKEVREHFELTGEPFSPHRLEASIPIDQAERFLKAIEQLQAENQAQAEQLAESKRQQTHLRDMNYDNKPLYERIAELEAEKVRLPPENEAWQE